MSTLGEENKSPARGNGDAKIVSRGVGGGGEEGGGTIILVQSVGRVGESGRNQSPSEKGLVGHVAAAVTQRFGKTRRSAILERR